MKQLWYQKYRPQTQEDYVFVDETQREMVQAWIKNRSIPNLLFSGNPGTGKTTLARLLINQIGVNEYDVLEVNGSKEGRKIEWLRDKLDSFCQTMPYGDFKVVLIDEADYLNKESVQPALRNLMEDLSETVRFILTCNYPNKIIPPLHSRFQHLRIPKTDPTEFTARVATILINESIDFDLEVLEDYVRATYPDMRKCINLLEMNSRDGRLSATSNSETESKEWRLDCVRLFREGKIREARTLVCQQSSPEEAEEVFRWMYDNLDLWGSTPEQQDEAIIIIRQGLVNHASVADVEINLSATFCELMMIGK